MAKFVETWTTDALEWEPRITPVVLEQATADQREALKITPSNMKISAYSLVLAHEPEALAERSPLYNAIMFGPRGLNRAERELGAIAASRYNGCIYCASVHARRYIELTKDAASVAEVYAKGAGAKLEARKQAVFDYALKLSKTPSEAGAAEIAALRASGMTDAEIFDLTNAVAMFGWANRLMQTLGDPIPA